MKKQLTGQALDDKIVRLTKYKRWAHRTTVGGFFGFLSMFAAAFICVWAGFEPPTVVFVIYFMLVFFSLLGGFLAETYFSHLCKNIAIDHTLVMLKEQMDELESYAPSSCVDDEYFNVSLGFPSYDDLSGEDYVKGVLHGIPIEFSEFTMVEERTERDSDGDLNTTRTTVFNGLAAICDHGLQLNGDLGITRFCTYIGGVKTESARFNETFSIYAEDGHDAFYVLTPHYMENLLQLSEQRGSFGLYFRKDGKLIIILRGMDLFELNDAQSSADLRQRLEGDLKALAEVLQLLEVPKRGQQGGAGKLAD